MYIHTYLHNNNNNNFFIYKQVAKSPTSRLRLEANLSRERSQLC